MKTSNLVKRSVLSMFALVTLVTAALFINGCTKESADLTGGTPDGSHLKIVNINNQYAQGCVYIYAGQNINVGSVCLDDIDTDSDGNDDALQVCVTTTGCWEMTSVKSWFGCGSCMPPINKAGQPVPGQFPYQSGTLATQTYCFNIPFSAIGFTCPGDAKSFRGAVHIDAHNTCDNTTQTGWAAGDRISSKGNWGTFFGFTIICDTPPDNPNICHETAWGYDASNSGSNATCFTSIDCISSNSWGWSNGLYTGDGSHTLTLRAGAGQCTGGTDVGTATFYRSGSTLYVTYTTSALHPLVKIHFYAGSTPVSQNGQAGGNPNDPCSSSLNTVAPGQLGFIWEACAFPPCETATTTHSFTVTVSGDYYVCAHSEVGGFACTTNP